MPERFIEFGGFTPGLPEHGTSLMRAENAIPALGAWRPMGQHSAGGSTSVTGPLLGGYFHLYPSGIGTSTYVGDAQTEFWGSEHNLFSYASGAFTDISRLGTAYAVSPLVSAEWNFCSFGNDVWAANGVNAIQRRTDNAGLFANGPTSAFIPAARFVATVHNDFLVAAYLNQPGRFADEVAISDVGDATYFSPPDATRPSSAASSVRVRSRPGQITGLVGGDPGIVFKRRSMHALTFVGDTEYPFRLDEISSTTGTTCGKSIVDCADGFRRFWGGDGFYRQAGASPPEKVSPASLNNLLIEANMDSTWGYAMTRLLPTTMSVEGLRIVGAESRQSGVVFWLYQTRAASTEQLMTRMVCHDPTSGEWGLINLEGAAGAGLSLGLTGLSHIISAPINASQKQSLTWDLVGAWTDGADATRYVFDQVTPMQATFATRRFALAPDGGLSTASPRITGFLPILSREPSSGSPDYNLKALPSGITVRVIGSTDPHFADLVDEAGTQVSPRSEVFVKQADFGWFTGALQARWFIVEMTYPAGGDNERGFVGGYVRWEE